MTPRKKQGGQKPPESEAEEGPFTSSNLHMQQAVAYYAWTQRQAQIAARIAADMVMFGGSRAALLEYQVPASETKEGIERERAYYEALGRFVQIFAEVEKLVWQTLVHYAGVSHEVAKIVLTSGKVDQCVTYIKQIAAAINAPKDKCDDLELVLQQLGILNGVRDTILHYGATAIAEGRGTVSNAWKVKAKPKEFPISDITLIEMTDDARKIIAHLTYHHIGRPSSGAPDISSLQQVLRRPWRYKYPSQPKTRTKKAEAALVRKQRPKLPRQPQS